MSDGGKMENAGSGGENEKVGKDKSLNGIKKQVTFFAATQH